MGQRRVMRRSMWSPKGCGRHWMITLVIMVSALCGLSGCDRPAHSPAAQSGPLTSTVAPSSSAAAPPGAAAPSTPSQNCPLPQSGFDCDFQGRLAAVQTYTGTRPGTIGVVLRDRQTGAVWRNSAASTTMWTESTIKLAMAVDLLLRDRAGTINLTNADHSQIQRMLHSSDDDAADALWNKYSGSDNTAFNRDFAKYGMTSLTPEHGYSSVYPYWGFQKGTPNDLDRLVNYLLNEAPASVRSYIVGQLSSVAPNQQWGVWAAGRAAEPGNKDGWGQEDTGWVMNTVGWAGPSQRYTLVVMNSLNHHGGYDDGRLTDSHIAELLFAGRAL